MVIDRFLAGARSQLAKSLGVASVVAAGLWLRPDIAWVLVLGWCGAGAWTAVRHYQSAAKVAAVAAQRRKEIVVTEVAPQSSVRLARALATGAERERCVAILRQFIVSVPETADNMSEQVDAFAAKIGNAAIASAIRAVLGDQVKAMEDGGC